MMKMMLVAIFFIATAIGCAANSDDCQNCGCCNSNGCYHNSKICLTGCKNGYWGQKCYNTCPPKCATCGKQSSVNRHYEYEICYTCADGYYNGNGVKDCSNVKCPKSCESCSSPNNCTSCMAGFYNGYDNTSSYSSNCSHRCLKTCSTCSSYYKCDKCNTGRFGTTCNQTCSVGCATSDCNFESGKCANGCKVQFTGDFCEQCVSGYHGTECNITCPFCNEGQCNRYNGNCLKGCTFPNLTGHKCDSCIHGTYGNVCQHKCLETCKNTVCARENGTCLECAFENFEGIYCNVCKNNFYGDKCEFRCPINCKYGLCERFSGSCLDCSGNFRGVSCDTCEIGYYLQNCNDKCPSPNCEGNICEKNTGVCIKCETGKFGIYCNKTCSAGCERSVCDQSNGSCLGGCRPGYSGDKCCIENDNCYICSSTTQCFTCKTGFFGLNCSLKCDKNCETCHKNTGTCESCHEGYFGKQCNQSCPINCSGKDLNIKTLKKICNQTDGTCFECVEGFYGHTCGNRCNDKCVNTSCIQGSGVCEHGCLAGHELHGDECISLTESHTAGNAPAVVGGSIGGIIAIVIAVLIIVIIVRRRHHGKKSIESTDEAFYPSRFSDLGPLSSDGPVYENSLPPKKNIDDKIQPGLTSKTLNSNNGRDEDKTNRDENACYSNTIKKSSTIEVSELFTFVSKKNKEFFAKEFNGLPKTFVLPCTEARKPINIVKNRYNDDHSRVKIPDRPDFFINACYIDGYSRPNVYIASLGPTKKATENFVAFWEMVWHARSEVIIMLTKLDEVTGMKCEKYWPDENQSEIYGEVQVTCDGEEEFAEYTVRTFRALQKKERRTVTHFHFTAWPDKGVPDDVTSMIEFRQSVKSVSNETEYPIIVHCSAGIGRTGTYIALDRLTQEGEQRGTVDVVHCVSSMRQQRVGMVQTKEQYEYLYRALVHSLTFDCEAIPAEAFQDFVKSPGTAQYRKKIQGNRGRPRLYLNRCSNESDYINAINLDSFRRKYHFIVAQTPLPETVQDFLCLIYQENCSCVVSMEDVPSETMDFGTYIPANYTLHIGNFTVTSKECTSTEQYRLTLVEIENVGKQEPGKKDFYHFEFKKWNSTTKVPAESNDFVQFIKDVESKDKKSKSDRTAVLVHCLNGAEKSALFCAVSVLIEKLDAVGQVSVVNTLRQVRARRKLAIPNVEQFEFCHRCVSSYLGMCSTYTNVSMMNE